MRELAKKYQFDYLLTDEYPPLALPVVYTNDYYTIYATAVPFSPQTPSTQTPSTQHPTMPTTLQAVVFDLDGLMFNTEGLYQQVGTEILRRRGKEFTAELIDQMMGRQAPKALQLMIDWHKLDDTVDEIAAESMEIMFRCCPINCSRCRGS